MIGNLKSLVGQLARSKVFSDDGNSVTQEQTVALCIQLVSEKLVRMPADELRAEISGEVKGILAMYAAEKVGV